MKIVQPVQSFDQIKLLADSRRMEILRLLMASPATLTHLAQILKQSPAWVKHHILALEASDLVEVSEIRRTGKGMTTVVGRVRRDPLFDIKFVVLSHNTIRGAAGASIYNAELLVNENLL